MALRPEEWDREGIDIPEGEASDKLSDEKRIQIIFDALKHRRYFLIDKARELQREVSEIESAMKEFEQPQQGRSHNGQ